MRTVQNDTDKNSQQSQQIFSADTSSGSSGSCDVLVDIHDEELYDKTNFELSVANLVRLEENLPKILQKVSNGNGSPLFEHIVIPTIHNCCGKLLQIKPTYATIQVYELEYTTIARSYHIRCKICKCTYYHGYKESAAGVRIFDISESKLLVFNSGQGVLFL